MDQTPAIHQMLSEKIEEHKKIETQLWNITNTGMEPCHIILTMELATIAEIYDFYHKYQAKAFWTKYHDRDYSLIL